MTRLWAGLLAGMLVVASMAGSRSIDGVEQTSFHLMFDELPDRSARAIAEGVGAKQYFIVYQSSDPNAVRTGVIDSDAVVASIRRDASSSPLPGWGMLDFEDPFQQNLQKGIDAPECRIAVATMVELIRRVKAEFPGVRWTFYGVPSLPYWIGEGGTWSSTADSVKRAELEKASRVYAPIVDEVDWVSPTIYPKYDPALLSYQSEEATRMQGRAWRVAQVGLARLLAKGKPVIPNVCTWWTPGGKASYCTVVPMEQFIGDQIKPALQAGASGVAFWGAIGFTARRVSSVDQSKFVQEKNFGTPEWRSAIVKDYLGGRVPDDWSDPMLADRIRSALCRTMTNAMLETRAERAKGSAPR